MQWDSSGGAATGRVVKVARKSGKIKDFAYRASADDPRYSVETDEGKQAAHKVGELRQAGTKKSGAKKSTTKKRAAKKARKK